MAKSKRQPPPVGTHQPWDSPGSQGEIALRVAIDTLGDPRIGPPSAFREYVFCPGRAYRADYCWPQQGLIVEVNGGQFKTVGGSHNRDKDRWRMAEAVALGFRVLFLSPQQIEEDPGRCISYIEQALGIGPGVTELWGGWALGGESPPLEGKPSHLRPL